MLQEIITSASLGKRLFTYGTVSYYAWSTPCNAKTLM